MSSTIPDALRNFDDLPNAASVRVDTVAALYGVSVSTIWRYVKAGIVPTPQKISHKVTAWNVGELRRAREAKAA